MDEYAQKVKLAFVNEVARLIASRFSGISVAASMQGFVDVTSGNQSFLVAIVLVVQDEVERITGINICCHPQLQPFLADNANSLQALLPPDADLDIRQIYNVRPQERELPFFAR